MLNYIILVTHSSHHYSIWNFTHTCIPDNLPPHVWVLASLMLCGLQDLFMGHEQVLLASPCLMGLSLHWCIIHGLPRVNLARLLSFMEISHLIICLAPLTIILLCWAFSKIICVGFMTFLVQYTVPAPTTKGTRPTPFAKGLQVHTPYSHSNCKRNLDNLATLLLDIHVWVKFHIK